MILEIVSHSASSCSDDDEDDEEDDDDLNGHSWAVALHTSSDPWLSFLSRRLRCVPSWCRLRRAEEALLMARRRLDVDVQSPSGGIAKGFGSCWGVMGSVLLRCWGP